MVMGAAREGRKISYVTDTMYFPQIADYVHDSDILFCEGMFEKALRDTAREKKHMTSYEASMEFRKKYGLKAARRAPQFSKR